MVLVLQSNGIPIEMMIMMNDNNNDDAKDASLRYVNHYADEKQLIFHHAAKISCNITGMRIVIVTTIMDG